MGETPGEPLICRIVSFPARADVRPTSFLAELAPLPKAGTRNHEATKTRRGVAAAEVFVRTIVLGGKTTARFVSGLDPGVAAGPGLGHGSGVVGRSRCGFAARGGIGTWRGSGCWGVFVKTGQLDYAAARALDADGGNMIALALKFHLRFLGGALRYGGPGSCLCRSPKGRGIGLGHHRHPGVWTLVCRKDPGGEGDEGSFRMSVHRGLEPSRFARRNCPT